MTATPIDHAIVVRALEKALDEQDTNVHTAMWRIGQLAHRSSPGKERVRLDEARRILDDAAASYDGVAAQLQLARIARNQAASGPAAEEKGT